MRRTSKSPLKRLARAVHHAIFIESREGRAAEVIAWSNGATGVGVGALVAWMSWARGATTSFGLGLATAAVAFCMLRLALANRVTVWIAAFLGTLSAAAIGGTLAWVFSHVLESIPSFPSIAAAAGAILAGALPAWSYAQLARHRADHVRDSLFDPVSLPRSR